MKRLSHRTLWILAILAALLVGFALARFTLTPASEPARAEHSDDDDHAAHGDDEAGESHTAHGAAEGHDEDSEHGEHEEESEAPEGWVGLTAEQIESSGIDIVAVGRGGGNETRLSGRVEPAVSARASVAAAIGGRVERVIVAPGSSVKAGEPLAVIMSGDAASLRASADAARAEAEVARLTFKRDQTLVEQGVVARQELEASRARSLAADASARAAVAQVDAAGTPDSSGRVTITSPMDGVVSTVQITPGGFVSAGDLVANIADPSQTELLFTAPPALASQVAAGTRVEVTGPNGNFTATVIGSAADVHAQGGAATVPADAVQSVDGRSVVFVASDAGFQATPVLTGRRAGGHIEILNGLVGAERVAGTNAFLLKAELAKGEAEHGH
jgi:cobalt-zinc-cadmium efflux system membrane fusion protein